MEKNLVGWTVGAVALGVGGIVLGLALPEDERPKRQGLTVVQPAR